MNLYKATIERVPNNCYVETVIIIATDKDHAHKQLLKKNKEWGVKYTEELEEISINLNRSKVIRVGRGHNDNNCGGIDF